MPVAKLEAVTYVTQERAYEIIAAMTDVLQINANAADIFQGQSVEYGMIYVVVLPFGSSLLLPFAIQNALS